MKRIDDGTTQIDFLLLNGSPDPIGETLDEITRPNVDSHSYRKKGKRSAPYQLFSREDVDDPSDLKARLETYKTFQGKFVTITDSVGNIRDNVMIIAVTQQRMKTIVGATGQLISTTAGAMIEALWLCQETDES